MERGPPPDSVVTSDRRVSSPSAANTAACCRRFATPGSWPARGRSLDVLPLRRPAAVVHAERLRTALGRHLVEAGRGEQQQRPGRGLLQAKLDQRGRRLRVVDLRIDAVRVPGEAEEPLGLESLHHRLPAHVLVAGVGDPSLRELTRYERTFQLHVKPLAELAVVREGAPHAPERRLELDAFVDALIHIGNLRVAY